ncbi:hypothetical protein GCM10010914_02150 [Deinococcus wulumuqiensis]|uniref:Uncharacterized protein n=1 Tax=Deinococcus wulumuqiensis TaxID=980427 RepID=A0AAV4K614_9DEIO|nr:hypothetical protein GCM10010914_02150 [Deinococcus wulumuqiensis]GGP28393.1 hypothetical protein GCM10008021_00440 [Deinococcus wulumuqiensis]
MAGASRDQKLAASITPAASPCAMFRSRLLTERVNRTTEAPRAVSDQVKIVASRACVGGARLSKKAKSTPGIVPHPSQKSGRRGTDDQTIQTGNCPD